MKENENSTSIPYESFEISTSNMKNKNKNDNLTGQSLLSLKSYHDKADLSLLQTLHTQTREIRAGQGAISAYLDGESKIISSIDRDMDTLDSKLKKENNKHYK